LKMLSRDFRRLSLCVGPFLVFLYFSFILYRDSPDIGSTAKAWIGPGQSSQDDGRWKDEPDEADALGLKPPGDLSNDIQQPPASHDGQDHLEAQDGSLLTPPTDLDNNEKDQEPLDLALLDESHPEGDSSSPNTIQDAPAAIDDQHDPVQNVEPHEHSGEQLSTALDRADESPDNTTMSHNLLQSLSTPDGKFFKIDFGQEKGMNPNIIPHPELEDTWIVVAQKAMDKPSWRFTEIFCDAVFEDNVLRCTRPPNVLPVAPTAGDGCQGDLDHLQMNIGPHDARVFHGPSSPLVVYGSNSRFTCFGQFVHDLRALVDWGNEIPGAADFRLGTELQRPEPWGAVEKNWFLFWDAEHQPFVHYDLLPKRVFAKLNLDGSVSPDLAVFAEDQDIACMRRMMPSLDSDLESIHQATNSLRITLCARGEQDCASNTSNTFIFTIYQHKTYFDFHSVYEPYVMLFRQNAPFDIYAMSRLPLWIHGRNVREEAGTSDLFYVTSMSWKKKGQSYDGYLDDELFLAFGIEDKASGGIDIRAKDLFASLELCQPL
jgi:hypothetical protein